MKKLFLLAFVIILLFNSCKKDKVVKYLTGTVVHKYTKKPIDGVKLQLQNIYTSNGYFFGGGKKIFAETITNNAGFYQFEMNDSFANEKNYNIETLAPSKFDSTLVACQFIPEQNNIVLGFKKNRNQIIELLPSGIVNINISSEWQNIIAFEYDSVTISSKYETKNVIKNNNIIEFYVDASQLNTFEFYFFSSSSKSSKYSKQFFVSNCFRGGVNKIIIKP